MQVNTVAVGVIILPFNVPTIYTGLPAAAPVIL